MGDRKWTGYVRTLKTEVWVQMRASPPTPCRGWKHVTPHLRMGTSERRRTLVPSSWGCCTESSREMLRRMPGTGWTLSKQEQSCCCCCYERCEHSEKMKFSVNWSNRKKLPEKGRAGTRVGSDGQEMRTCCVLFFLESSWSQSSKWRYLSSIIKMVLLLTLWILLLVKTIVSV